MQSTSEMWLGFITVKWRIWWEENWSQKEVGEWKIGMSRHPEYLEMQWDSLGLWAWSLRKYLTVGWWRYQGTWLDHSGKHLLFPPNAFKKWRQADTPRSILQEQAKAANWGELLNLTPSSITSCMCLGSQIGVSSVAPRAKFQIIHIKFHKLARQIPTSLPNKSNFTKFTSRMGLPSSPCKGESKNLQIEIECRVQMPAPPPTC